VSYKGRYLPIACRTATAVACTSTELRPNELIHHDDCRNLSECWWAIFKRVKTRPILLFISRSLDSAMSGLEVVGAVASIMQLAQVVYEISKSLYEVGTALASASSEILDLAQDLEIFSDELRLHKTLVNAANRCYSDEVNRLTAKIIGRCATICGKIDRILKKLRTGGIYAKIRWLYKEKEIKKLLERLRDLKLSLLGTLSHLKSLEADHMMNALGYAKSSLLKGAQGEKMSRETLADIEQSRRKLMTLPMSVDVPASMYFKVQESARSCVPAESTCPKDHYQESQDNISSLATSSTQLCSIIPQVSGAKNLESGVSCPEILETILFANPRGLESVDSFHSARSHQAYNNQDTTNTRPVQAPQWRPHENSQYCSFQMPSARSEGGFAVPSTASSAHGSLDSFLSGSLQGDMPRPFITGDPQQQNRGNVPPQVANLHPGYMSQSLQEQQALAYQNYVIQQQRSGGYMPPQTEPPSNSGIAVGSCDMEPSHPIPSGLDSEPQKANHRRESKYQDCEFTGFHQVNHPAQHSHTNAIPPYQMHGLASITDRRHDDHTRRTIPGIDSSQSQHGDDFKNPLVGQLWWMAFLKMQEKDPSHYHALARIWDSTTLSKYPELAREHVHYVQSVRSQVKALFEHREPTISDPVVRCFDQVLEILDVVEKTVGFHTGAFAWMCLCKTISASRFLGSYFKA